jgi:hypothetical protein
MLLRLGVLCSGLVWLGCGAAAVEADDGLVPNNLPTHTQVHLEFLGRGLVPTARVVINNPDSFRVHLPRRWTYEVVSQPALTDPLQRSSLPGISAGEHFSLKRLTCLPEAKVTITFAEDAIFRSSTGNAPISIPSRRSWGHDHEFDLRLAKIRDGIIFIRLTFAAGSSDWVRYRLPEVPDLPLVRFTLESRKLGTDHFARAEKQAEVVVNGVLDSGEWPWCRVLTLAANDPLAKTYPRLLVDGKSTQVLADGERARFAIRGFAEGKFSADARVLAILTER